MNIVCIGAGYVGCVTAASFAAFGHHTTIIDIHSDKLKVIESGKSPIYEPGLDVLIANTVGRNLFTNTSYTPVADADVVFICVGTPSNSDGSADLQAVKQAAIHIARHLKPNQFTVIVTKSTVPVGTTDLISSLIERTAPLTDGKQFNVVSNPEFLREGFALHDIFYPDRIIIGSDNSRGRSLLKRLYESIINKMGYEELEKRLGMNPETSSKRKTVYYETDPKSAELIKYTSNAFLAVKISFINEVARLCDALGANVEDVAKGMGLDSRIGSRYLQVSSGWSGSCLPKDTLELLSTSLRYKQELTIVKAAVESNIRMYEYCLEKIQVHLTTLTGKTIGILGLTFKPDTDDARQTQAAYFIKLFIEYGAEVRVHDPRGMTMFQSLNPDLPVHYCDHPEDISYGADAVLLLTHWEMYRELNWRSMREQARGDYILDTRNFLQKSTLQAAGFHYEGIGIPH